MKQNRADCLDRYHWSVEYFEDLRNINHCEFIIMKQNPDNGKYILQNELRTWSELKRRMGPIGTPNDSSLILSGPPNAHSSSSTIPIRRWGGCANGCSHDKINYPRRKRRQNTGDFTNLPHPPVAENEQEDNPLPSEEVDRNGSPARNGKSKKSPSLENEEHSSDSEFEEAASNIHHRSNSYKSSGSRKHHSTASSHRLHPGRDFGGSRSGAATPAEGFSDDSDYAFMNEKHRSSAGGKTSTHGRHHNRSASRSRGESRSKERTRQRTEREWAAESGMGAGKMADALGDGDAGDAEAAEVDAAGHLEGKMMEKEVEEMKDKSRKGFSEVY